MSETRSSNTFCIRPKLKCIAVRQTPVEYCIRLRLDVPTSACLPAYMNPTLKSESILKIKFPKNVSWNIRTAKFNFLTVWTFRSRNDFRLFNYTMDSYYDLLTSSETGWALYLPMFVYAKPDLSGRNRIVRVLRTSESIRVVVYFTYGLIYGH